LAPPATALPESYGTGRLFLAVRDPHCLYAHWDLSLEQQRDYNALSADRHLIVRLHRDQPATKPLHEIHVHPESRYWFVHVERAGASYAAELGYYSAQGQWHSLACSDPVTTPPDSPSEDKTLHFARIGLEILELRPPALASGDQEGGSGQSPARGSQVGMPVAEELALPPESPTRRFEPAARITALIVPDRVGWIPPLGLGAPSLPPITTLPSLLAPGPEAQPPDLQTGRTEPSATPIPFGTPAQEEMLAQLLAQVRAQPLGISSPTVSSPPGGLPPAPQEFWLAVNADLIIYGATDAKAVLTLAGQPVELRPDGTFSCRFSLPDGNFGLDVVAISAEGLVCQAALQFSRQTDYQEAAPAAAQEPALRLPGG